MAVSLSPFAGAGWQFFTDNGVPLAGGKLYVYSAGTTSSAITYTSSTGSIANTNPIILNSAGRLANEIWLTVGLNYKFILKTSTDVLVGSWDNIPAGTTDVADLQAALASSTGAGMIGYIQGGVDAVTTTVQSKLRETVSVKDFGAVGDGVADDTAAIQAAINATSNAVLFFPSGTYITSGINLTSRITIQGEGKLTTWIKLKVGASSGDCIIKASVDFNGLQIKDIGLNGNWKDDPYSPTTTINNYGTGIYAGCWNSIFSNIAILNCANNGISIGGVSNLSTSCVENYIQNSDIQYNGEHGVAFITTNATDNYVLNNVINGNLASGKYGVYLGSNGGHLVSGNHFYSNDSDIYLTGNYVNVTNNYFDGHTKNNILCAQSNQSGRLISNNMFGTYGQTGYSCIKSDGISGSWCQNISVIGNAFSNALGGNQVDYCINASYSDQWVIGGNTFNGFSTDAVIVSALGGGATAPIYFTNKNYEKVNANAITFPATAVPAAGATTLDDYREQTYTAYISDGTNQVQLDSGRIIKIGGLVQIWAWGYSKNISGFNSSQLRITLPFNAVNGDNMLSVTLAGSTAAGLAIPQNGQSYALLFSGPGVSANLTNITKSSFASSTTASIWVYGCYQAN